MNKNNIIRVKISFAAFFISISSLLNCGDYTNVNLQVDAQEDQDRCPYYPVLTLFKRTLEGDIASTGFTLNVRYDEMDLPLQYFNTVEGADSFAVFHKDLYLGDDYTDFPENEPYIYLCMVDTLPQANDGKYRPGFSYRDADTTVHRETRSVVAKGMLVRRYKTELFDSSDIYVNFVCAHELGHQFNCAFPNEHCGDRSCVMYDSIPPSTQWHFCANCRDFLFKMP